MAKSDAMERLQNLQRDLIAFTESRLPTLDRLAAELDASIDDLRKLLEKKKKNEESRKKVNPTATPKPDTLKIQDEEYRVSEDFRQAALQVADELDLDEVEAAQLCVEVEGEVDRGADTALPYRALLRFHRHRYVVLDCLRLLLQQTLDLEAGDEIGAAFQEYAEKVLRRQDGQSAFWQKCMEGLNDVEAYLKKIADHRQTAIMTGMSVRGEIEDALVAQRFLLIRQHECLAATMSYSIRGGHVEISDFRSLLSKAAGIEGPSDAAMHYLPILNSGSAYFGADGATSANDAKEVYELFAPGPKQQQWKLANFRAATTALWLAEYSSRFSDPTSAQTLRVADRQKEEEARSKLFADALKDGSFHFLLTTCQFLKPEIWYDPAKVGLVRFLLDDAQSLPADTTPPSPEFADLVMSELQAYSDAFITNMPDDLRRLQLQEDERRRLYFSGPPDANHQQEFHLERFLVIMSYAYQDDAEAAQDFWSDRESNLYGFLSWTSKRLPTPRVAAFCELLRSIASDEKSGNQAHLFLLEDSAMSSGKLRKTYSVSWSQIFSELEIYASTVKNKAVNPNQATTQDSTDANFIEPETYIMLEAYLRLASHICRVSPDARNWILRGQNFHLGETLFQLASTGNEARVHASCFDLLSALLTDKVSEVNDGMWVLLDNWISGGVPGGSGVPRTTGRQPPAERQYLLNYATSLETATGLVNLLNALVTPSQHQVELTQDTLPFPENLGSSSRHAGIDAYVDFVLDPVFKSTQPAMNVANDQVQVDVLRCACLNFICVCLSTFNEDLVALANSSSVAIDSAIKTTSLAAYARLHPFARVMEWMFNNNVIHAMASTAQRDIDELNALDPGTPHVQATLRSVQAMNLAMRFQATYLDIVRPLVETRPASRSKPLVNSAFASYDDVIISQLDIVADIASFASSTSTELSLESLSLLQKLCASRRLSDTSRHADGGRLRLGNRLVGKLTETSEAIAIEVKPYFQVFEWDLETGEPPLKLIKAKAIVDVLNNSLDTSGGRPSVAHCLLGFACDGPTIRIEPESAFNHSQSLFHTLAAYAAQSPYAIGESNISWLLSAKRGAADVILKLALSPLTSSIVIGELRAMEYLSASSQNQLLALANPLWDQKSLQDPTLLLEESAVAVREFFHARKDYFEYAALDLRAANKAQAYSVQEKIMSTLLGAIKYPSGGQEETNSVFDLFDFFDLETPGACDASCKYLQDVDLSMCVKDDADTVTAFDLPMAEQLLILRKRVLVNAGSIKEPHEEQQVDDEVRAILASLTSQNHWRSIRAARVAALEAWTDLVSLMTTATGLASEKLNGIALQGLQVVLPRFERALGENLDAAALLAKLTLTLVPVAAAAGSGTAEPLNRRASLAHERLLAAFRVCLKVITDSGSGLALRDVCYRTCCAVLSALPLATINGQPAPSPNAKQLLQLVQGTGERLIAVITEDAFSGRGVTRVSALLFLDGLVSLFQLSKVTSAMLRALTKLNFIPVLIDQSIGSVASSFQTDNDELLTAVAYFHTSLSLLLRVCQTADGTQLVLHSGFFAAVADGRLFSTDPDIGLDIDNPVALREFYRLLSAVLRVVTAVVIARGPGNATVIQQAKSFLQENRFSMQAVFKRTSAVQKTAGPPESEAMDVADEFGKLLLVTGFLEDDEPAYAKTSRMNGFT